jgi:hypothetical protein
MQNTNLISASNLDHMKCHVNKMVGSFCNEEQMLNQIESAMCHFDYESETIETEVFSYCLDFSRVTLENKNAEYNKWLIGK